MRRLLILSAMMAILFVICSCNQPTSPSKVTILAHYTIQPLENDHSLLVVDLKGDPDVANVTKALNDIAIHYGKIIGSPTSYCTWGAHYNPTTHLFVRIEAFKRDSTP